MMRRIKKWLLHRCLHICLPHKILIYHRDDNKALTITKSDLIAYVELILSYRSIKSSYDANRAKYEEYEAQLEADSWKGI